MSEKKIQVFTSAQGLLMAIDVTIHHITDQKKLLNKTKVEDLDEDTLSAHFFFRAMFDMQLAFCQSNALTIAEQYKKLSNTEDKSQEGLILILIQKLIDIRKDNATYMDKISSRLSGTNITKH
jgi:hypothetical protein